MDNKYQLHYVGLQVEDNGIVTENTDPYILGLENDPDDIDNSLFDSHESALASLTFKLRDGVIPAWLGVRADVEDITHEWWGWETVLRLTWQDDSYAGETHVSVSIKEYVKESKD